MPLSKCSFELDIFFHDSKCLDRSTKAKKVYEYIAQGLEGHLHLLRPSLSNLDSLINCRVLVGTQISITIQCYWKVV